jgi:hypothetical protein
MEPRIFVSHSSEDRVILDELTSLLVVSIDGLDKRDLRYTSRPATGLWTGNLITPTLASEIANCDCFVAVVSESWCHSQYCASEIGAALASGKQPVVGYLPGINPEQAGKTLSGMNMLPLKEPESVQHLLREVASTADAWTCNVEIHQIEKFCNRVAVHPRNPVQEWRKRLVPVKGGHIFLNGYGLLQKPVHRSIFQNFHPGGPNIQPVQYMWTDSRKGNWIKAELVMAPKPPDSLLRIEFHNSAGSLGCNVSIRPLDREALFLGEATSLHIDARVPDESKITEVGIVVRLVNGYMQHWRSSAAQMPRILHGDFQDVSSELDPRCWALFDSDGTGEAGPTDRPDFSIISSVNIELGGWGDFAPVPTPGDGIVELREIRFE